MGTFAKSRLALKQYDGSDLTEMHLLSSISRIDRYEVVRISEQYSLFLLFQEVWNFYSRLVVLF
jgi:hypothetical protein